MLKSLETKKIQFFQLISTMAIAVALQAIITQSPCSFAVYEPKMPEALKKEMTK